MLRQVAAGARVTEVCRRTGATQKSCGWPYAARKAELGKRDRPLNNKRVIECGHKTWTLLLHVRVKGVV